MIPGPGTSPREGNDTPLQYSCLGNAMNREPARLQSMESQRVGHDLATKPQSLNTVVLLCFLRAAVHVSVLELTAWFPCILLATLF